MKPYQPSLVAPAGGLALLLLACVIGGAAIGILTSLLSNTLYLIIVFPLIMGLLGGWIVSTLVRVGKIRNPMVAVGAGVLISVIIYGAMWATDYAQFRSAAGVEIAASNPTLDAGGVQAAVDSGLLKTAGQPGFMGYALLQDQQGVAIGRVSSDKTLVNLGPTLSWLYWVVELVLILWMAIATGRRPAYQPFCESCNRWFGKEQLLGTLGASRSKELMDLVNGGLFLKLGEELQTNPALPNLAVFIATCGDEFPDGDAYLAIRSQARNSGGNLVAKPVAAGTISSLQRQDLERGIQNRKALYGG
jgi:hypothetical protein